MSLGNDIGSGSGAALEVAMSVTSRPLTGREGPVETLLADPPRPAQATVVYVHGHGFHAVASLPLAWYLTQAGYRCLLVSQPGYGGSPGPPDYCGPRTVGAVLEAADQLVLDGLAVAGRIAIWGFSRGSIVTGQAIRQRPELFAAAILQSGGYDLERDHAESRDAGFRANLMAETGGDRRALRERSLIHHAAQIRCPVLVLHGDRDPTYMPANAGRLAAELERHRREHVFRLLPGEHELPWEAAIAEAIPFLLRRLPPG